MYDQVFSSEERLRSCKFVKKLDEDEDMLVTFQQESWYCQPPSWKPRNVGEFWHGTVSQICTLYNLNDFSMPPDFKAASWNEFNDSINPLALSSNPNKSSYVLYKLKKAKWFQYLNSVQQEIILI